MTVARLLTFPDRERCARRLADDLGVRVQQALEHRRRARLLLPGGSGPQLLLPLLREQLSDWSRVDLSPTDERWVAADDAHSNLKLLRDGLPDARVFDPRQAHEASEAARVWGDRLLDWRPFDAVLLGMGEDGHFASLFPGMAGLAAALDPQAPPGGLMGLAPNAPHQRLSLNVSLLCDTAWLGLLVFGAAKRDILDQVLASRAQGCEYPVHALVWNDQQPLHIYWAP